MEQHYSLAEAYKRGQTGFWYYVGPEGRTVANATNTEFATVLGNPEYLKKAVFYENGKVVPTEEVIRRTLEGTQ
jgi:hypothetical protein